MKILIKECKKIMDIRVLLVIAVFTVLFYYLFLEVTIYPAGGQTTDSQYDMPVSYTHLTLPTICSV